MTYGILVHWTDEDGAERWHICKGYNKRDASTVYNMWAEHQTPYVKKIHELQTLGVECL